MYSNWSFPVLLVCSEKKNCLKRKKKKGQFSQLIEENGLRWSPWSPKEKSFEIFFGETSVELLIFIICLSSKAQTSISRLIVSTIIEYGDLPKPFEDSSMVKMVEMIGWRLMLCVASFMIALAGTVSASSRGRSSHLTVKEHLQWVLFECLTRIACSFSFLNVNWLPRKATRKDHIHYRIDEGIGFALWWTYMYIRQTSTTSGLHDTKIQYPTILTNITKVS